MMKLWEVKRVLEKNIFEHFNDTKSPIDIPQFAMTVTLICATPFCRVSEGVLVSTIKFKVPISFSFIALRVIMCCVRVRRALVRCGTARETWTQRTQTDGMV